MADCYSNYLRDAINDHLKGRTTYTAPATTYFALMTTAPTASGGGTEASGGAYARVAVTNNTTNWPASSGQTKSNGTAIDWGTATANLGTIVAIAEYDANTSGNLLTFASLTTPVTINIGAAVRGAGWWWHLPAGQHKRKPNTKCLFNTQAEPTSMPRFPPLQIRHPVKPQNPARYRWDD